jgi:hypothetical protein
MSFLTLIFGLADVFLGSLPVQMVDSEVRIAIIENLVS